jgi:perosamine synthetase
MKDSLNALAFTKWKSFLQGANTAKELVSRSYSFQVNNREFSLVPFAFMDLESETLVSNLSKWRQEHIYAYPTRSTITDSGTKKWLEQAVLNNNHRMLFWIVDTSLQRIGHIGIVYDEDNSCIEIDNVLRGVADFVPGLMAAALLRIEAICEEEFSVGNVYLRVLESNSHAVNFYRGLGYILESVQELTWVGDSENKSLLPGSPKHDAFLRMRKAIQGLNGHIPELILTAGPSISPLEVSYVADAVTHGWNSHHSDYLNRFELEFAEYVGAKYAMATSSCTGALHLSLLALGIGPGDEVLVPDITWVATASAIRYVGAKPIFVDIDKSTWTINVEDASKLITSATKAIMPVHLYGYGAPMPEIMTLARSHGLFVIEDAAPAIGTLIGSKFAGTYGDFGCYSFQGAKLLVTGEGGMLVTNDSDLFAKAKKIQDHGRKPGTFWIEELGHKYKMNNITAALGLGQIERSDNQIFRKRRINKWYLDGLSEVPGISFQSEAFDTRSICWMTSFTLDSDRGVTRDELILELKKRGIDSRPVFPSISQYEIWGYRANIPINSKFVGDNGINLPSGVLLNRNSIEKVIQAIKVILK